MSLVLSSWEAVKVYNGLFNFFTFPYKVNGRTARVQMALSEMWRNIFAQMEVKDGIINMTA